MANYTKSGMGITASVTEFTDNLPYLAEALPDELKYIMKTCAEEAVNDTRDITPMKTGELRNNVRIQFFGVTNKLSISWTARNARGQDYAKYQENIEYENYTTPGTHSHFMEATYYDLAARLGTEIPAGMANIVNKYKVK